MQELISVIIPIHNAEKYLTQCLDSVINQTYHNLEIILVDDCSDDGSTEICDAYAARDLRVHVIHQEKKGGEGGANARNSGMKQAHGQVIYFMDSDDYIEHDMLSRMYEMMCMEKSDCVITSFHYVDCNGRELYWHTPRLSDYVTMNGREAARIFLLTLNIEGFSWNKLIRREVIEKKQIQFDESMNSFVDMYGMFLTVLSSGRVSFYDAKPYYYRQHNVSCVHTMNKRKLNNFRRVIIQICELANKNELNNESEFFFLYRLIAQLFDAIKAKKNYDKNAWKQIKQEYKWSVTFKRSLWQVFSTIFYYLNEEKLKTGIKIFAVWWYFK